MLRFNNQRTLSTNHTRANLFKRILVFGLFIPFLLIACEENSVTTPDPEPDRELVWENALNDDADNWITDDTSGPKGWCGDIAHYNITSGPVSPSSGSGYAVAKHGKCNDFWQSQNIPSSGPYAFFGELSSQWPSGGFVQELDIYLDPSWSAGSNNTVFTYANSFRLLDGEYPDNLRYLFIPVTKQDGNLLVTGNKVSEKGWYTFSIIFSNQENNLGVKFELLKDDQKVFSTAINKTGFSKEQVSSFEAKNAGNGYGLFVAIKPDLGVPVDDQQKFHLNK